MISFMHQKPLGTANTEGFYFGLGCRLFYFFFRPNHLRSIVMISSTMMPDATPANTEKRKEYNDIICAPPFRHQYRERQRWDYITFFQKNL